MCGGKGGNLFVLSPLYKKHINHTHTHTCITRVWGVIAGKAASLTSIVCKSLTINDLNGGDPKKYLLLPATARVV